MFLTNRRDSDAPRERGFRASPARPLALLSACPAHAATRLHEPSGLARKLGVGALWIKDETARMGLGSFKALGGAFAAAQLVLDRAGAAEITAPAARAVAAETVFVTASAGNHGLSVATGARLFGARAQILLPSGVPETFADRIARSGGEVIRVDGSYEDSVAEAARLADAKGWLHLADGSWAGYTAAPALVMEGYAVLAEECRAAFAGRGRWPTHVLLQAGVGGLAAAAAAHIRTSWAEQPEIVVVEPEAASCLMESVRAGRLTRASGKASNMGRLDCKDASLLAFESLRYDADAFITVSDEQAVAAVARLAAAGIMTTPSGAAGCAALQALAPGPDAACMIIASEGPDGA